MRGHAGHYCDRTTITKRPEVARGLGCHMTFRLLWTDREIEGRIYIQANFLFAGELISETKKDAFYDRHLWAVMHKLSAMKYHLERYAEADATLAQEALRMWAKSPGHTFEALPLIFEFESFLFQLKSALDMLVKMLDSLGLKWSLPTKTYEDEGDALIGSLNGYRARVEKLLGEGKSPAHPSENLTKIDALIALVETARDDWLSRAVDWRDRITHVQGARDFVFTPSEDLGGIITAERPRYKGEEPLAFMQRAYARAVEYHQDFLAHALTLVCGFELGPANSEFAAQMGERHAPYIKWGWLSGPGEYVTSLTRLP